MQQPFPVYWTVFQIHLIFYRTVKLCIIFRSNKKKKNLHIRDLIKKHLTWNNHFMCLMARFNIMPTSIINLRPHIRTYKCVNDSVVNIWLFIWVHRWKSDVLLADQHICAWIILCIYIYDDVGWWLYITERKREKLWIRHPKTIKNITYPLT